MNDQDFHDRLADLIQDMLDSGVPRDGLAETITAWAEHILDEED